MILGMASVKLYQTTQALGGQYTYAIGESSNQATRAPTLPPTGPSRSPTTFHPSTQAPSLSPSTSTAEPSKSPSSTLQPTKKPTTEEPSLVPSTSYNSFDDFTHLGPGKCVPYDDSWPEDWSESDREVTLVSCQAICILQECTCMSYNTDSNDCVIFAGTSSFIGTNTYLFQDYMTWAYNADPADLSTTSTTSSAETSSSDTETTSGSSDSTTSQSEETLTNDDDSGVNSSIYIAVAIIGVLVVGGGLTMYTQIAQKEEEKAKRTPDHVITVH